MMKTAILILAPALATATGGVDGSASGGDSLFDFSYTETHDGSCTHPVTSDSDNVETADGGSATEAGGIAVTYEMDCSSTLGAGILHYDSSKMKAMATFLGVNTTKHALQLYGHINGKVKSIHGLTLDTSAQAGLKPKKMEDDSLNDGVEMNSGMQKNDTDSVQVSNADGTNFKVTCVVQYDSQGVAKSSAITRDITTTGLPSPTKAGGSVAINHYNDNSKLCRWTATVDYDSTVEGQFWYGGWGAQTGQGDYQVPSEVAIPNSLYEYQHTSRSIDYTYAGFDFSTSLDQAVAAASAVPTDVSNQLALIQTVHAEHTEAADQLDYQMACTADLLINPHKPVENVIYSDDPFLLQTVVICYELKVNGTEGTGHEVDQEIISSIQLSDQTDVFGSTPNGGKCRGGTAGVYSGIPTVWVPTDVVTEADMTGSSAEECEELEKFYTVSYIDAVSGEVETDQLVDSSFDVTVNVADDMTSDEFGGKPALFRMVNIDVKDGASKITTGDLSSDTFADIQTRLTTAGGGINLAVGMPFINTRSWARVVVDTTGAQPWPAITDFQIKFDGGVKANLLNSALGNSVSESSSNP